MSVIHGLGLYCIYTKCSGCFSRYDSCPLKVRDIGGGTQRGVTAVKQRYSACNQRLALYN